ncbi:transglycosylase SLT domain-containing protein [Camelimonas abortus]|uniref:Transglycosylase SLT domain-containing protein n=1 Tax=Camelimonas abortus TaxID=1017184 RepID=A0ABV7LDW4_9HYPH
MIKIRTFARSGCACALAAFLTGGVVVAAREATPLSTLQPPGAAPAPPLVVLRECKAPPVISAGQVKVPANVARSLARASDNSGVDLRLLIGVARRESGFRPDARAKTSSAAGLFQFIDSTWLRAVRDYGASHGLAKEAAMIDAGGEVADPAARREILALRDNPDIAAAIAADMLRDDARKLQARLDRNLTDADIYATHFLGVTKASHLAQLVATKPAAAAAPAFPAAARANRSIFYRRSGRRSRSRTIRAVYDSLALPYAAETDAVARQVRRLLGGALKPDMQFVGVSGPPATGADAGPKTPPVATKPAVRRALRRRAAASRTAAHARARRARGGHVHGRARR